MTEGKGVVTASEGKFANVRAKSGRDWSHVSARAALYVCLTLGGLVMVYPLLWLLMSSFKPDVEIFSEPTSLPKSLSPANYLEGWVAPTPDFTRYYINSFIVCAGAVVGNVMGCSLAAFAFARLKFPMRRTLFAIMLITMMLPSHALLIPQYILYFNLGWVNTYLPLIVPKFLATDGFFVFLMVQFIRRIPRQLDEAAKLDGCNTFRIYLYIILPLLKPAVVTTIIFTFIWTYNDFFSQLIYLTSPDKLTVPVGIRGLIDASGGPYGQLLAMSAVSLVPTFIVFLIFQKRLVSGLSTTGVKG